MNRCDSVRCSVTFDTSRDLLYAMNKFIKMVNNNETGCIIQILRIKNGLYNIRNWRNYKDSHYCDVKFNVLILAICQFFAMIFLFW